MQYSISDWVRLDHHDRQVVSGAVDRGERLEDPRLRPVAASYACALLRDSGWRILRRPAPILGMIIAAIILVVFGWWWVLLIVSIFAVVALWIVDRRAQRLRSRWHEAFVANRDDEQ